MDCQLLIGILTGITGIVGTLSAVLLTNFLQGKKERKRASIDFCKTFTDMMYLLTSIKEQYPFPAISQMIVSHEMAIIAFHPYLRKGSVRSFDEAWKEYHDECKKYCKVFDFKLEQWMKDREGLAKKLDKLLAIAREN